MHGLIRDCLEDYLRSGPGRTVPPEIEDHLRHCEECREELSWMQEQSRLVRSLSAPGEMDPAPGFYARIMERVESQRSSSIWSVFLEPAFGRRLLATSVAVAMLLGGYLAYTEARAGIEPQDAEAIMAVQQHPPGLGQDRQRDRDTILVTLATYRD